MRYCSWDEALRNNVKDHDNGNYSTKFRERGLSQRGCLGSKWNYLRFTTQGQWRQTKRTVDFNIFLHLCLSASQLLLIEKDWVDVAFSQLCKLKHVHSPKTHFRLMYYMTLVVYLPPNVGRSLLHHDSSGCAWVVCTVEASSADSSILKKGHKSSSVGASHFSGHSMTEKSCMTSMKPPLSRGAYADLMFC